MTTHRRAIRAHRHSCGRRLRPGHSRSRIWNGDGRSQRRSQDQADGDGGPVASGQSVSALSFACGSVASVQPVAAECRDGSDDDDGQTGGNAPEPRTIRSLPFAGACKMLVRPPGTVVGWPPISIQLAPFPPNISCGRDGKPPAAISTTQASVSQRTLRAIGAKCVVETVMAPQTSRASRLIQDGARRIRHVISGQRPRL